MAFVAYQKLGLEKVTDSELQSITDTETLNNPNIVYTYGPNNSIRNLKTTYTVDANNATVKDQFTNTIYEFDSAAAIGTGVGLTSGIPIGLPRGPRAAVEVAGNQVNGFLYYDTTNNIARKYNNGAWANL